MDWKIRLKNMKCYKLSHNYSEIGDSEKDAFIYEYKGFDKISSKMLRNEKLSLPKPMFFSADFKGDTFTDYPITDIHYPIMSGKMLEAIDSNIKNHLIEIYPCTMIDDTFLENPFKQEGLLKEEVKRKNKYFLVQLEVIDNIFNHDDSIYSESLIFPGKIGTIKKLVLKEPKDGFSPFFRIPQYPGIFISEKTKNNLEKHNITGCVFEVIETSTLEKVQPREIINTIVMEWTEIKKGLAALQTSSGQTYGKTKLQKLLTNLDEHEKITITKDGENILVENRQQLQELINTYDRNIKISDIV